MNLLNIIPIHYKTYDCYQNNILSVIRDYYKIEYRQCFWRGFDFNFQNNETDTSPELWKPAGYNRLLKPVLLDVCGIELKEWFSTAKEDWINILTNQLSQGNPVGICIDSYHLPWNQFYKQEYRYHFCLICGMDLSTDRIYCCV